MDIAEFLTARLDEDEDVAIAAARGASFATTHGDGAPNWTVELATTIRGDPKGWRFVEVRGLGTPATHIARWDPARVLAEVKAKRRIVARYAYRRSMQSEGAIGPADWDDLTRHYYEVCRDLAATYADDPGFDPAWRVDS